MTETIELIDVNFRGRNRRDYMVKVGRRELRIEVERISPHRLGLRFEKNADWMSMTPAEAEAVQSLLTEQEEFKSFKETA